MFEKHISELGFTDYQLAFLRCGNKNAPGYRQVLTAGCYYNRYVITTDGARLHACRVTPEHRFSTPEKYALIDMGNGDVSTPYPTIEAVYPSMTFYRQIALSIPELKNALRVFGRFDNWRVLPITITTTPDTLTLKAKKDDIEFERTMVANVGFHFTTKLQWQFIWDSLKMFSDSAHKVRKTLPDEKIYIHLPIPDYLTGDVYTPVVFSKMGWGVYDDAFSILMPT